MNSCSALYVDEVSVHFVQSPQLLLSLYCFFEAAFPFTRSLVVAFSFYFARTHARTHVAELSVCVCIFNFHRLIWSLSVISCFRFFILANLVAVSCPIPLYMSLNLYTQIIWKDVVSINNTEFSPLSFVSRMRSQELGQLTLFFLKTTQSNLSIHAIVCVTHDCIHIKISLYWQMPSSSLCKYWHISYSLWLCVRDRELFSHTCWHPAIDKQK